MGTHDLPGEAFRHIGQVRVSVAAIIAMIRAVVGVLFSIRSAPPPFQNPVRAIPMSTLNEISLQRA